MLHLKVFQGTEQSITTKPNKGEDKQREIRWESLALLNSSFETYEAQVALRVNMLN